MIWTFCSGVKCLRFLAMVLPPYGEDYHILRKNPIPSEAKQMKPNENMVSLHASMHERIYFLDSMRAIAIIMVVGVHTLGYCVELPQHQKEIISFIVHYISVPVFFLVDGYLFARGVKFFKGHWYLKIFRNSSFRLLAPWFIFTFAYALSRYAFELTGFLDKKLILGHDWQEVVISAYGSVYAPQMYFLFSLFLIRLCSPIFKQLVIIKSYYVTLSLFFLYYLISPIPERICITT